jgi:hypothetical protein
MRVHGTIPTWCFHFLDLDLVRWDRHRIRPSNQLKPSLFPWVGKLPFVRNCNHKNLSD